MSAMPSPLSEEPESDLPLPEPLSMTDEERDIAAFQLYLRKLPPEELWDVYAHLDADRYPRRHEAVRRQMNRCRLLFFPLYNEFESRLRCLFFTAVIFAAFAAVIHGIPLAMEAMARTAQEMGGDATPTNYGQALRYATLHVSGLSERESDGFHAWMCFFRGLTMVCLAVMAGILPYAFYRALRRRLRPDVVATGVIAALIAGGLLRLAFP